MLFKQHNESSHLNSTHYAMLYPQNADRIVVIDSVTSLSLTLRIVTRQKIRNLLCPTLSLSCNVCQCRVLQFHALHFRPSLFFLAFSSLRHSCPLLAFPVFSLVPFIFCIF